MSLDAETFERPIPHSLLFPALCRCPNGASDRLLMSLSSRTGIFLRPADRSFRLPWRYCWQQRDRLLASTKNGKRRRIMLTESEVDCVEYSPTKRH